MLETKKHKAILQITVLIELRNTARVKISCETQGKHNTRIVKLALKYGQPVGRAWEVLEQCLEIL